MNDLAYVLEQTGLTYRKLDFWVRQGYLRPERDGDGSGHPRGWTNTEIAVAKLMAVLVDGGLVPAAAAVYAREMQALIEDGFRPRLQLSEALSIEVVTGALTAGVS